MNRLTIQVHLDKVFSKQVFQSDYGKTEAWYILGGRKVDGEDPYILLGFKPGITKEVWRKLFEKQDIQGMLDSLHKVYIKPGDVFIIYGGVPHAIGSGCFLIEIQEPTDYTLRVERTTPEGRKMPDMLCHQGAGFEKMLDAFHYEGFTTEQMLNKWYVSPELLSDSDNGTAHRLIGPSQTNLFSMNRINVKESLDSSKTNSFSIAIVNSGTGSVKYESGSLTIKQGDYLFIPAGVEKYNWINFGSNSLEIIECFPPKAM